MMALGVMSCSPALERKKPFKLEPVNFKSLPGWGDDNHSDALGVFRGSCQKFLAKNSGSPSNRLGLNLDSWHRVCLSLPAGDVNDDEPTTAGALSLLGWCFEVRGGVGKYQAREFGRGGPG